LIPCCQWPDLVSDALAFKIPNIGQKKGCHISMKILEKGIFFKKKSNQKEKGSELTQHTTNST